MVHRSPHHQALAAYRRRCVAGVASAGKFSDTLRVIHSECYSANRADIWPVVRTASAEAAAPAGTHLRFETTVTRLGTTSFTLRQTWLPWSNPWRQPEWWASSSNPYRRPSRYGRSVSRVLGVPYCPWLA
jgi:hypothetical protein